MGRPKKKTDDTVKGSFIIPSDLHKSLSRLARHKGISFNEFLVKILSDFAKQNEPILKILDETDKKIAELETKGGDGGA